MLDFPSSGLVAGTTTYTGPSGQEWLWDGVKWTAVGGGGGGGASGPQMGVTDGSNAAPGEIGEYLSTWVFSGLPASMAVTAGDWDITATLLRAPGGTTAPMNELLFAFSGTGTIKGPSGSDVSLLRIAMDPQWYWILSITMHGRLLASTAGNLTVREMYGTSGAEYGDGIFISARRMR